MTVEPGLYRHYKGDLYRVLLVARDSTNGRNEGREMVVYISDANHGWRVRDAAEFNGLVTRGELPHAVWVRRFERILKEAAEPT